MFHFTKIAVAAVSLLTLTACGQGGGDSAGSSEATKAPAAQPSDAVPCDGLDLPV